jgi:uncharacterized Zn-finger protein
MLKLNDSETDRISNCLSLFKGTEIAPEDRRYKCKFCSKGFKRREHLKNHERVHTGEKPFKCDFCDTAFSDPSNFRKHKKKHFMNFSTEHLSLNTECIIPPYQNNLEKPAMSIGSTSPPSIL